MTPLAFEIRTGYGGPRAWPLSDEALTFCTALGQKTLTLKQLAEFTAVIPFAVSTNLRGYDHLTGKEFYREDS